MAQAKAAAYRAFISYSHGDAAWAKWLHKRLESYKVGKDLIARETAMGPVPKTLAPIFRDRDEFAAGHGLKEQTQTALEGAAALIVVCSPSAAASAYVNEEIRLFKHRYAARPVIPVIVAGAPGDPAAECFPDALRFEIDQTGQVTDAPAEILAADVRDAADGTTLALAKVIAALLGLSTDEIYRRGERERAKRQRRWVGGLSAVALSLAGLAIWAEINRREAQANFNLAKQGADALVVDIAQGLREVEGMRAASVRKILGRADEVISGLVENSNNNLDLSRTKVTMLNEFVETYLAVGDTDAAAAAAAGALAMARDVSGALDGDVDAGRALGRSIMKVGDAFNEVGNFAAAIKHYQESLDWRGQLSAQFPDHLRARRDVTISLNRLGEVAEIQARFSEARAYYSDALQITRGLVQNKPEWKRDLIVSNILVGDAALAEGDVGGAGAAFDAALETARDLAAAEENTKHQRDLAIVLQRLGNVAVEEGAAPAAEAAFQECLATFERLAKTDPDNVEWRHDIAISTLKLGHAAKVASDQPLSIARYGDAASKFRALLFQNSENIMWRTDLAETLMHLAEVSTAPQRGRAAAEALAILDALEAKNGPDPLQQKWRGKLATIVTP